jgi:valine--pyruvate aminotransferase
MELSTIGGRMSSMSGLRSIMEDIATSTAGTDAAEWLNLSIGNPALIPEVVTMWRRLTEHALADGFAEGSCQYGPSRGDPRLISAIADYFGQRYGWDIGTANIVVGPGSQMLCFIAAALYAGPSAGGSTRVVLPMTPDYTGYQGLCLNPDGIAGIESTITTSGDRYFEYAFDMARVERSPHMGMLLLSSPSNPTSRCVRPEELDGLVRVAERRDVPFLLDQAYGEPFPQIGRTLAPPPFHPNVINCFSVSKAGLPGERIGFAIGPERYISPMVSFLSNSVLHASRLVQAAVASGLRSGEVDAVVSSVITPFYAARRKAAEKLLLDLMPATIDWRMHAADGGMFGWVWVNEDWFDDLELYRLLKLKHVFVAPGRAFFDASADPGGHHTKCFRINFTVGEDVLAEGLKRIADTLSELQARP